MSDNKNESLASAWVCAERKIRIKMNDIALEYDRDLVNQIANYFLHQHDDIDHTVKGILYNQVDQEASK